MNDALGREAGEAHIMQIGKYGSEFGSNQCSCGGAHEVGWSGWTGHKRLTPAPGNSGKDRSMSTMRGTGVNRM